jgi:hypothetical protein
MAYVCETLSSPAIITGQQTCNKWTVYVPPSTSILPELTAAERDDMLLWFIGIFAVVFIVKAIRRLLGF